MVDTVSGLEMYNMVGEKMNIFGQRLKELREKHGFTQEQLGEKISVTKGNISKYESGKLEPNIETIRLIANIFDVSTDYLLGRSDYRFSAHTQAAHIASEGTISEDVLDEIEEILKKAREELKKGKG